MILDFIRQHGLALFCLGGIAFVQNMCFTLTSRSRNSADPGFHRKAAWGSNGVWYACQMFIIKQVWSAIQAGNLTLVAVAGLVYVLATTEGSVLMMKIALKRERGSRRVGACITPRERQPEQEQTQERSAK